MALYGGRTGAQLKLKDALTTGYKFLMQPAFVIPILVIGVVVNFIVVAAILPIFENLTKTTGADATAAAAQISQAIAAAFAAIIAATIGGIILNLYGQVWAVMASTGEPPTMNGAFARVRDRWLSVLGAGFIAGAITIVGSTAVLLVGALLGGIGVIVIIAGLIGLAYVGLRLSLAGWIAAEGTAAMDSVKASWAVTGGHLMVVLGWGIVIGIVVTVLTTVVGLVLDLVPVIGSALTQTLGSAFGFGAGVTLYRRVKDA